MADSTSPEQQAAAAAVAPSALTSRRRPAPGHRPLPDAVAIHLVAVPDGAPPYDGAPPPTHPLPAGRDAADVSQAIAAIASLTRTSAERPGQSQFAGHWPSQFAQVLAETLAGSRPPSQIAPWTTRQTRRRINQLGPLLSTTHRPHIKRVVVTSPAGGVLEMAVIVGLGNRVRALAVRLERRPAGPAEVGPEGFADYHEPADQPPPAQEPVPPESVPPESVPPGSVPQASIRLLGEAGRAPTARKPQTAPHGWICTAIEAA